MDISDVRFVVEHTTANLGTKISEKALYDEILYNEMAHYYVGKDSHQKRVGYIGFWLTLPNAELLNMFVLESVRRQGYGKVLMEKMIEVCREHHIEVITLEVRESNAKAISFYEKFGFDKVTKRKQYYANGEDAYLMKKELGGS